MPENPQEDITREQRDAAIDMAIDQSVKRIDAETDRVAAERAAGEAAFQRDVADIQRSRVASERDAALRTSAVAQSALAIERQESEGNRVGFYTLLGVIVVALLIVAGVYFERGNNPTGTTVTVNRTLPSTAPTTVYVPSTPAPASSLPMEATPPPAAPATPAAPAAPAAPATPAPVAQAPTTTSTDDQTTTTTTTTSTTPNSTAAQDNSGAGTGSGSAGGGDATSTNQ